MLCEIDSLNERLRDILKCEILQEMANILLGKARFYAMLQELRVIISCYRANEQAPNRFSIANGDSFGELQPVNQMLLCELIVSIANGDSFGELHLVVGLRWLPELCFNREWRFFWGATLSRRWNRPTLTVSIANGDSFGELPSARKSAW